MEIPKREWTPSPASSWVGAVTRCLSFFCYPTLLPYAIFSHCDATVENARWWRSSFVGIGILGSVIGHGWLWKTWGVPRSTPLTLPHVACHTLWFLSWDSAYVWLAMIAHVLADVLAIDRTKNRLSSGRLYGPKVVVIGNGPSAVEGKECGDLIDTFDEVVRFNNFQLKAAGMERWVGRKTTVHFSDGVLFPTYKEYHVPQATIVLSLFADRFMVAGTYLIMRGGADGQFPLVRKFFADPETTWISKANIERLKKNIGLKGVKHPTSGMLAIDFFVNSPGVQLPVYIHGFDFFMGPKIHYFHDHEPLYERINNNIGVNMHCPPMEKIYVDKLIEEGKVKLLVDMK